MGAGSLGHGWFDVRPVTKNVTAIVEPRHAECVISYLIEGSDRAILLDTGMGVGDIAALASQLTSAPITVINSHAHWDHIGDNWRFAEIAIHEAESALLGEGVDTATLKRWFAPEHLRGPLPPGFDLDTFSIAPSQATRFLNEGDVVDLGDHSLSVLHLPGHSPGGIGLLDSSSGWLFSTDVAYPSVLYAYGSDADFAIYRNTMRRLADLVPDLTGVSGSHDGISMPPAMLIDMADALDSIAAGRMAERRDRDRDHHFFKGFSVFAPPTLKAERGDE
jgi:glyoxylase-like metal-dependent hydrolase (beta-lactamase superfamily II)